MPDSHKNLAVSSVAAAPSPAISGTSLTVAAGQGTWFPAPPFNATVWPATTNPDPTNAEIVRVTAVATDTLTITRNSEGAFGAKAIGVGYRVAAGPTVQTFLDIEAQLGTALAGMPAAKTANYPALATDTFIPVDTTSNLVNITLPNATALTMSTEITVKWVNGANAATVVGTIDGATNYLLSVLMDSVTVKPVTGSNAWYVK